MDNTKIALGAMIHAMADIVTPAVDPTDPIAVEQLQSAVRYLQFLADRIDLVHDRERFELAHHLAMAGAVSNSAAVVSPATAATLAAAASAGAASLDRPSASVSDLRECTVRLSAALRDLILAAGGADDAVCLQIESTVVEITKSRVMFERAWYLPLGFDQAAAEVPSLQELLSHFTSAPSPPTPEKVAATPVVGS